MERLRYPLRVHVNDAIIRPDLNSRMAQPLHVNDCFRAGRRHARLGRAAKGPHVDNTAVRLRLIANRAIGIPGVNARAGDIIHNPALTNRIPPPRLGFQMIVPIDPNARITSSWPSPVSYSRKARIDINIAFATQTFFPILDTTIVDYWCAIPYLSRFNERFPFYIAPDNATLQLRSAHVSAIVYSTAPICIIVTKCAVDKCGTTISPVHYATTSRPGHTCLISNNSTVI